MLNVNWLIAIGAGAIFVLLGIVSAILFVASRNDVANKTWDVANKTSME